MWDRQTESWWQQITGEAIVGEMTATKLKFIPAPVVSWKDFRESFPEGLLLSRDLGFRFQYDVAPYGSYDSDDNPYLFLGDLDKRLRATERVIGATIGDQSVAYPFTLMRKNPAINDSINGQDLVVFYVGGTFTPFVGGGSLQKRVGSSGVFEPFVDGEKLTFQFLDDVIVDEETGSRWNILGEAVDGPLRGSRLKAVVHGNHFWFAWAEFNPETSIRSAEDMG